MLGVLNELALRISVLVRREKKKAIATYGEIGVRKALRNSNAFFRDIDIDIDNNDNEEYNGFKRTVEDPVVVVVKQLIRGRLIRVRNLSKFVAARVLKEMVTHFGSFWNADLVPDVQQLYTGKKPESEPAPLILNADIVPRTGPTQNKIKTREIVKIFKGMCKGKKYANRALHAWLLRFIADLGCDGVEADYLINNFLPAFVSVTTAEKKQNAKTILNLIIHRMCMGDEKVIEASLCGTKFIIHNQNFRIPEATTNQKPTPSW